MKPAGFLTLILFFFALNGFSQNELSEYLKTHAYSFSSANGFDKETQAMLKEKLAPYKLILQGEGGSHNLKLYDRLPAIWVAFLNEIFGLTHYFGESGHSADILVNHYFNTGDTTYLNPRNKRWSTGFYALNSNLPPTRKLVYFGIDFEGSKHYVNALKLLLPKNVDVPELIRPSIELIKNANGQLIDCDYIIGINAMLKKAILANKSLFESYFGLKYTDVERIVFNGRNCRESMRDRNPNMTANLMAFDKTFQKDMYFGELGMGHACLNNRSAFANLINRTQEFKDKVCVITLFCDNCSTTEDGPADNWPLAKIEKDLKAFFLPFCKSDFTLFDLTENPELMGKYSAYGQFLIIARNQN